MKIYLSGPMSGIPQFNLPAFEEATAELRRRGHEVISPIEEDIRSGLDKNDLLKSDGTMNSFTQTWGECLARDVRTLADGGIEELWVLPRWERSKGARLEVFLALLLGVRIFNYATSESMKPNEVFAIMAVTILNRSTHA